jgi:uncharacterized phiE125 gp8 family phage protein
MRTVTITPTSSPTLNDVLTVADIKTFGRIDTNAEDSLILALRDAAAQYIEDYCNTSIGDRNALAYLEHFYTSTMPRGPVNSITQVEYLNIADQWTVLDSSKYWVDIERQRARIQFDNTPDLYDDAYHRVRITLNYGIPENQVPQSIKQAMRLLTLSMYDNRNATDHRGNANAIPEAVHALISQHRVL